MRFILFAILLSMLGWALLGCAVQPDVATMVPGEAQSSPSVSSGQVATQTSAGTPTESHTGSPALQPSAASRPAQRTPLVVFCAGSLILPFADLERIFEAQYPHIDVLNECHGSIQVIRHVTELHELIDVVATADHALIPMLMYTTTDPQTGQPYASWYARFALNHLALAFTPQSQGAAEINDQNWFEVITRPGVRLGIADPRFDAAGYRALMALKLAEGYYNQPDIFENVIKGSFRYPVAIFSEEGQSEITVPEIVEPLPDSGILIRGASIQLIALLESGDLDYAFEYESVIRQHGLQWVALPEAVNLGAAGQADAYAKIQVKLDFQRFASVKPVFRGEPIAYGVTIPSNAPHPEEAAQWIAFLLGPAGQAVMAQNYQPVIDPPVCDGQSHMPLALQALCATP